MKNFIPLTDVQKTLETLTEKVKEDLLNAVESPMNTEEAAKFLHYKSRKAFQNDAHKFPIHKIGNKIYCFKSELNNFIKNRSED